MRWTPAFLKVSRIGMSVPPFRLRVSPLQDHLGSRPGQQRADVPGQVHPAGRQGDRGGRAGRGHADQAVVRTGIDQGQEQPGRAARGQRSRGRCPEHEHVADGQGAVRAQRHDGLGRARGGRMPLQHRCIVPGLAAGQHGEHGSGRDGAGPAQREGAPWAAGGGIAAGCGGTPRGAVMAMEEHRVLSSDSGVVHLGRRTAYRHGARRPPPARVCRDPASGHAGRGPAGVVRPRPAPPGWRRGPSRPAGPG